MVDALELGEFKTRRVAEILGALGLAGESVLIVIADADEKLEMSARNLPRVGVIRSEGLNVYDVLRHARLVLTQSGRRGARPAALRRTAQGARSRGSARTESA